MLDLLYAYFISSLTRIQNFFDIKDKWLKYCIFVMSLFFMVHFFRAMELAKTAKEPLNYFQLLRSLFRSIGGGNHDLLYQEFLPLLPNLLQGDYSI